MMRRKPAACSKALAPRRGTFFKLVRALKAPFSSRKATMLEASVWLRPETRASSGADAVLTSTPTELTQSSTTASSERARPDLVDVVLVLADADRLRLDLDELGQRILQPARDRHRAAQADVEIGEFLRGQLGRRIDRGAGFRHHRLGQLQFGHLGHQLGDELVGLAPAGAVADADDVDLVLDAQRGQRRQRALPIAPRLVRIDRRRGDDLAGLIDDSDLDAGADAGVEAHGDAMPCRCRQQQILQVAREHADGLGVGALLEARQTDPFPTYPTACRARRAAPFRPARRRRGGRDRRCRKRS